MELNGTTDDRGRLARLLPAVALAAVAIASLRRGKRLTGALAGAGAVAVGYLAASKSDTVAESLDIVTPGDDGELRCAACGQRITPGQARGPNTDDEIVHVACRVSAD